MMLDQISRLSDGDHEQSIAIQVFLDCIDRATTPSTAFVWFRQQPMHFNDNHIQSLRVVDPIADEGVWAIKDDGCNSCCHGEVWRQNADAKKKVSQFGCIERQLLSMALERARQVESCTFLWPYDCKSLTW